ncbi:MAG: DNA-processing protein DprA [Clostridia bacterium]|nr:DNA-processing protein DprA [Clostridia bacterium]
MMGLKLWLWLTLLKGISSRKISALFEKFDSVEEIYKAKEEDYAGIFGISKRDARILSDKSLKYAEAVMEKCKNKGIRILTYDSPLYPQNLVHIYDPPYVLYVRSKERLDLNKHLCISVIGNREITDYGRAVTRKIAGDLAKEGVTVISGMARGADGEAHAAALKAGGKTIAVLGCGADICYPAEHKNLMQKIIENGMIISEYPPGTPPIGANFPKRNRIISGLSVGTVVTEAANPSGTLITASIALEQNREVFAVPGNITSEHSEACNKLIGNDGAKAVMSTDDILKDFRDCYADILSANKPDPKDEENNIEEKSEQILPINDMYKDLSETERCIVRNMSTVPIHIDELSQLTKIPADEILGLLTILEISGMVKSYPGKFFGLNI